MEFSKIWYSFWYFILAYYILSTLYAELKDSTDLVYENFGW